MNAIHRIRKLVLNITQNELAEIAGVSQATVSRWENGSLEPDRDQLSLIRQSAIQRNIKWDDSLFFLETESAA